MPEVVLGTANLFATVDVQRSRSILAASWEAGYRSFDTAPSYGHGEGERALGKLLSSRADDGRFVTTKVGIAAVPPPSPVVARVKALARRLPGPVQQRLRGEGPPGGGRFGVGEVRESVERSLRYLARIDRLMLHEVTPADITDELLDCLRGYLDRGDVGELGVATSNARAAACVARAPDLLTAAHLAVGVAADLTHLSSGVRQVGHGALGPAAADVQLLRERVRRDPAWSARWRRSAEGTPWSGTEPGADALLARAASLDIEALIVATSQPARLPALRAAINDPVGLSAELTALLNELRPAA